MPGRGSDSSARRVSQVLAMARLSSVRIFMLQPARIRGVTPRRTFSELRARTFFPAVVVGEAAVGDEIAGGEEGGGEWRLEG